MARAMLHNKDVARNLWGEAVNTACHIVNRVYFRPGRKKTPYELWKGKRPNVKYFRIFGSTPLQARLIGYATREPTR